MMEIRLLGQGDEALFVQAARQFNGVTLSTSEATEFLADPTFLLVIACDDTGVMLGRVYGHVLRRFGQTDLFLYEVDVEEAYRQKGVGRAMIEMLKALSLRRDYGEMFVLTECDNAAGNGLYRAAGSILEGSPANVHVFPTPDA